MCRGREHRIKCRGHRGRVVPVKVERAWWRGAHKIRCLEHRWTQRQGGHNTRGREHSRYSKRVDTR